jgi:hypothetical protein
MAPLAPEGAASSCGGTRMYTREDEAVEEIVAAFAAALALLLPV